tara:strand:+ start:2498 stop:3016 length:519 start_codon:yes stop_codon:yes gene_type:complete
MKKKFIYIFIFFFILTPCFAGEKIVYLDVEKIMQQSIAGKSIISQIKKKRENTISKIKKKEKEIINKEKNLISQKNILNKDEFEKKIKDLRNDISIFQKERTKSANSITKSRIEATKKLLKILTPILEEYSKKNSIKIIVQKKNIVMGRKEDDITSDILDLINQKVKNIKID